MRRATENLAAMRDIGAPDGETRTRTGDTTIFRQARCAARGRERPGNSALYAGSIDRRDIRSLRKIAVDSGDGPQLISRSRACARGSRRRPPRGRPRHRDTLDGTRIDLHVVRSPREPLGLEETRGQQERRPFVRVRQRMVHDEVPERYGRLLDQRRVRLDPADRRERRMQRGLGQRKPWESGDGGAISAEQVCRDIDEVLQGGFPPRRHTSRYSARRSNVSRCSAVKPQHGGARGSVGRGWAWRSHPNARRMQRALRSIEALAAMCGLRHPHLRSPVESCTGCRSPCTRPSLTGTRPD